MTGLIVLIAVVCVLLCAWLQWEHRMIDRRAEAGRARGLLDDGSLEAELEALTRAALTPAPKPRDWDWPEQTGRRDKELP